MLLLAGPLQSWGSSARFARRTTGQAPSKSGVLGLLAAAQGRDRTADPSDLAQLRFGVRVDQRGTRIRDYQTAHRPDTGEAMPVSERFYLADAVFVAGAEGDDDLIGELDRALREPAYLPYLGRRSCPPSRPVALGLRRETTLEAVLRREEWHAAEWYQRRHRNEPEVTLDCFLDAAEGDREVDSVRDLPLSFDPSHRRYALRGVTRRGVAVPNPKADPPDHDPMSALEGD
ncbi:CRISPR system Cascade subunit CasD [Haloactinospora alba]|uniref:CRISPR system Cascade subunit CasD n=1 Tax=Haloactinospora alba TaxID=405555 RepID=A0A543NHA0_9ACTN|nr:CRISPR system Cascade subunit CasD [Haloactinospora alba]